MLHPLLIPAGRNLISQFYWHAKALKIIDAEILNISKLLCVLTDEVGKTYNLSIFHKEVYQELKE